MSEVKSAQEIQTNHPVLAYSQKSTPASKGRAATNGLPDYRDLSVEEAYSAITSSDVEWRFLGLQRLGEEPGDAARQCIEYMAQNDPAPRVRCEAVNILGFRKAPESVQLLTTIARNDPNLHVHNAAVRALDSMSAGVLSIVQCFRDADCKGTRICEKGRCTYPRHMLTTGRPQLSKLERELADAKRSAIGWGVAAGLGIGFGIGWFISGSTFEDEVQRTMYTGGGVCLGLGVLSAAGMIVFNVKASKLKKKLKLAGGIGYNQRAVVGRDDDGMLARNATADEFYLKVQWSF